MKGVSFTLESGRDRKHTGLAIPAFSFRCAVSSLTCGASSTTLAILAATIFRRTFEVVEAAAVHIRGARVSEIPERRVGADIVSAES
jgi:hypothetical protein